MTASLFPWYLLPQIELVRFRAIDFFPPKPSLEMLDRICVGTKSRAIGDALMLSSLPRKLKRSFPKLKVNVYPRGFNPVVFWNNPYVDGISYIPESLYGDDCNEGFGHLIELKDQFFGLESDPFPRPEIYLTDSEEKTARDFFSKNPDDSRRRLPVLVIHPFGRTVGQVLSLDLWHEFVRLWRGEVQILQVGAQGQPRIEGCDHYFLAGQGRAEGRRLFALTSNAAGFIGVDSGPMHVARAFSVPSMAVIREGNVSEIFENRRSAPYFLRQNRQHGFLYEDQLCVSAAHLGHNELLKTMGRHVEAVLSRVDQFPAA